MNDLHLFLAADWYILVSPWKPLFAFAYVLAVGWLVSTKLDKDAQYFHLPRRNWNLAHLIAIMSGLAVMWLPVPIWWWFYMAIIVGPIIMMSTTLAYWYYRNARVPEENKFYLSADALRSSMADRAQAKAARSATVALAGADGVQRALPSKEDPAFGVHIAMEELISPAMVARASTLELAPAKGGMYQVRQIVDGVRYQREPLDPSMANAVVDYLKSAAGLDVGDKRRRQRGIVSVTFGVEPHEVHVRTAGSSAGQTMTMEFDLRKRVKIPVDKLGLTSRQMESLKKAVAPQHGVVLLTAPADNGRTSTFYGVLGLHDAFTSNIRTLEFERLLQLDGVGHTEWDPDGDTSFAIQLRSMLRRDPTIMAVAEVPDVETAQEAAGPGPKGPLVYVSMRADSGRDALATWVKAVGDPKKAAAPLQAVVAQKLMRTLCENCKVPYQPNAEQLKRLGVPADQVKQLFKHSGKILDRNREITCPNCGGIGYIGQTGVFEVMAFDDDARVLLSKGDLNGLRTHMRRQKMLSLQEAALRKAIEGTTSIDEVIRVTQPKKSSSGDGKSAKKAG